MWPQTEIRVLCSHPAPLSARAGSLLGPDPKPTLPAANTELVATWALVLHWLSLRAMFPAVTSWGK